jgi:hypothetical protein
VQVKKTWMTRNPDLNLTIEDKIDETHNK